MGRPYPLPTLSVAHALAQPGLVPVVVDGLPSVREDMLSVQTPGCIAFINVPLAKAVALSSLDSVGGGMGCIP